MRGAPARLENQRLAHFLRFRAAKNPPPGNLAAEGRRLLRSGAGDGPSTGRRLQSARALRDANVTIWDAVRVRDPLRHEGRDRVEGKILSMPLSWPRYLRSTRDGEVLPALGGEIPLVGTFSSAGCPPVVTA